MAKDRQNRKWVMEGSPRESVQGQLRTIRTSCEEEKFPCLLDWPPGWATRNKTVGALSMHHCCTASLTAGTDVASVVKCQLLCFAILSLGPGWSLQNLEVPQNGEGLEEKEKRRKINYYGGQKWNKGSCKDHRIRHVLRENCMDKAEHPPTGPTMSWWHLSSWWMQPTDALPREARGW